MNELDVEISILVNSAGKAHLNLIQNHTVDMCFFMINVNVNAMVFLSRYYGEKFLKKNQELVASGCHKRSAIINFSSIVAYTGEAQKLSLYSATKGFNRIFSLSLTADYAS